MQRSILRLVPLVSILSAACLLSGCALTPEELNWDWPLPREGQWLLVDVRLESGGYSSVTLVSHNHENTASQLTKIWYAQVSPTASSVMRLLNAYHGDKQPTLLEFTTQPGTKDPVTSIGVHITATHPDCITKSRHYGTTQ